LRELTHATLVKLRKF